MFHCHVQPQHTPQEPIPTGTLQGKQRDPRALLQTDRRRERVMWRWRAGGRQWARQRGLNHLEGRIDDGEVSKSYTLRKKRGILRAVRSA